jgi:hypothetical protein
MGRNSCTGISNMAIKVAENWRTAGICPIHKKEDNCNTSIIEGSPYQMYVIKF